MRRFFIAPEAVQDGQIHFDSALAHHISHVLRLKTGDEVTATTGDGQLLLARLTTFANDTIIAQIIGQSEASGEAQTEVTLFQGLPKGDKLEWIIQKCTELGVSRITPVATERAVVKLDSAKGQKKQERWQKIAQEAAQQAKRLIVPSVDAPITFAQLLAQIDDDALTLVLWEDEQTCGLKETLNAAPSLDRVNLIIGPEGGLSPKEVEALRHKGAHSVTLGKRILRTETAGLAALAMVLYHTGDLG